jgi:hypothetical protein
MSAVLKYTKIKVVGVRAKTVDREVAARAATTNDNSRRLSDRLIYAGLDNHTRREHKKRKRYGSLENYAYLLLCSYTFMPFLL